MRGGTTGLLLALRAAAEMARRQAMLFPSEDAEEPALDAALDGAPAGALHRAINVASTDFRMCDDDGTILGLLVGEGGQVVGIRLRPDVANEMTRNMLRTTRAASTC
jgi:hypothetical protein